MNTPMKTFRSEIRKNLSRPMSLATDGRINDVSTYNLQPALTVLHIIHYLYWENK